MDNFDESPNTTNTLTSDESNTCLTSNSIESSSDQETLWVYSYSYYNIYNILSLFIILDW